jgi:hypothetical protein
MNSPLHCVSTEWMGVGAYTAVCTKFHHCHGGSSMGLGNRSALGAGLLPARHLI